MILRSAKLACLGSLLALTGCGKFIFTSSTPKPPPAKPAPSSDSTAGVKPGTGSAGDSSSGDSSAVVSGPIVTTANGEPVYVKAGSDVIVDSAGNPILDSSGKPVKVGTETTGLVVQGKVIDGVSGNVVLDPSTSSPLKPDDKGRIVNSGGKPITGSDGKAITVSQGQIFPKAGGTVKVVDGMGREISADKKIVIINGGKLVAVDSSTYFPKIANSVKDSGAGTVATPTKPGSFGYASWVEVRNCQQFFSNPTDYQKCTDYLDNISATRKVEICTDVNRMERSGGAICDAEGKLCRSGSEGKGARLWSCHLNKYEEKAPRGAWTEVRNCQADFAVSQEAGALCLSFLSKFGPSVTCTDEDRLAVRGGAICDKKGKLCRSGGDGKGHRLWVCHLPQIKPTLKAVGGWMEIRNCQGDSAAGNGPECLAYLDSIQPAGTKSCTDEERVAFTGGGKCDAPGKYCRSGNKHRLFICY